MFDKIATANPSAALDLGIAMNWIDGQWIGSGKDLDSFDPATGRRIGRYASATREEVLSAIAAAVRAFESTDWKNNRKLRAKVLFDRPLRIAREIDAGTIWINDWAIVWDEFEEGGFKRSGNGRLNGLTAMDEFLKFKHIAFNSGILSRS